MKVTKVKSLGELKRVLTRDMKRKQRMIEAAQGRAAKKHAAYLRTHIPVAFGELRASVRAEGTRIIVDAPHAAAVEVGSRPHWVPLEALLKWVKLRGFQGLATDKSLSRLPGSTTADHARRVAGQLEDQRRGGSGHSGPATPYNDADDPIKVAKSIQLAISIKGTKPHWYMRDSIPAARGFLSVEIHAALTKSGEG